MNGMKAKAERIKKAKRFTPDGLPRDANEWTVEDWRDLHRAMEKVRASIAKRHRATNATL